MIFNRENLFATFACLPSIVEDYIASIPDEVLDRKRGDSAWTIREHLYHLAGVQEMLHQRILTIRNEETPVIKPYFPENEPDRDSLFDSVKDALDHYKACREKQADVLEKLGDAELTREAIHPEYLRYNIPIIVNHIVFHEYWHMYRIEELWLTRDEYFGQE